MKTGRLLREMTSTQVRVSPDSKWSWVGLTRHLMKKFWILTSVLYRIEASQTSSDNCFRLFIEVVQTAGGKVFLVLLLSGNRKCYFIELLVNLPSPGCPGVPALLKGPCRLVLSVEAWVWEIDGIVEVFSVVSSRFVGLKGSPVCSWDSHPFPLPALINLALSPAPFPFPSYRVL